MAYFASPGYQKQCLTSPVVPSLMWGAGFSVISVLQGARATPQLFALNCGMLYGYHAMQCPMEAIHRRQSLLHNILSGGVGGALGVQYGLLGVPFASPTFFMRYPGISPPMAAFLVYGSLAGVMGGMLGGKRL
ncbi:unnamed protein product [Polarella glacialis]|uniref:Uncharacterized protein n=1 Tax=Polarella glacialis TaxID=89957 RepID=A0A813K0V1_POLGL|nr:unnamed protein product [Polarella glacialis]CAE8694121.1 unnamed protein product [Polarella glacialis]